MESTDGLYLLVPLWATIIMANISFMLNKTATGIIWLTFAIVILLIYIFIFLIPLSKHNQKSQEQKVEKKIKYNQRKNR